jgi:hypothetical protein
MIETLVKPQPLDNDVAVMKILHLMGQLSINDINYVLKVVKQVHEAVIEPIPFAGMVNLEENVNGY